LTAGINLCSTNGVAMPAAEMLSFPVIKTKRLVLRQMVLSDVDSVFSFKSDREVTSMYGQDPHQSIDQTAQWIENNIQGFLQRTSFMWSIARLEDDIAIGGCCFWNIDQDSLHAEIGYELGKDNWGQGIAREALIGILDYGFRELGFHRVEACPLARNERSIRLLQGLGFQYEGKLSERILFKDKYLDQLYYGILDIEWSSGRD
jgi:[ribosomal protein S5]-alanine N-acetyltransferase